MNNHLQSKTTSRILSVATRTTICLLILGASMQAAPSGQPASQPVSLNNNPRCGSLALSQLAEAMKLPPKVCQSLLAAPAPARGYSVAELLTLAQTNGLILRAVRRAPGAELVLPCIVHWKSGHFSTLLERSRARYRTADPLFGSHGWISSEAVASGSSGAFLLPRGSVPPSWPVLSSAEAATVFGGAEVVDPLPTLPDDEEPPGNDCCDDGDDQDADCDPPSANDGPDEGGGDPPPPPCCCDMGMPNWYINQPYCNQFIIDRPLTYRTSNQKWFPLKLVYKNRGLDHGTNIGGFGPKWECNWIGILQTSASSTATNFMSGGGVRPYTSGTPAYSDGRVMVNGGGLSLASPRGGQNTYSYPAAAQAGLTNNFLDRRIDRYGRVVRYNYETNGTVIRLKTVVDIDGRTNTLAYTNSARPYLITSVSDPYGRTARFGYSSAGLLTNITDTSGMSASVAYSTNSFNTNTSVTNLNTPYGNTAFQHLATANDSARAVLVTEASGDKQLFAYRASSLDSIPCGGSMRLSFHWNRSQFAAISDQGKTNFLDMPTADYQKAPVKSWLLYADGQTLSETLAASAEAYDPLLSVRPGCVSFTYQGQTNIARVGSIKRVTSISRDGQSLRAIARTSLGRPSGVTNFFTDGSFTSYANTFEASGRYLQSQSGPRSESVRGYGYHNATITNLLTAVTNAAGDWVLYAHDTNTMKVTSVTFSSGLVRSNIYYSSGNSKGFLQTTIDVGIRTNSFSYLYGNLASWTNELGLVRTFTWDNLSRLTSTVFPDGTTRSNLYDKLDLLGVKDRLGLWTSYYFDSVRQLTNEVSANGAVTTYTYCGCGAPSSISRWLGGNALTTQFYYDIAGRLTNTTFADNYQINRAYDQHDRLKTVTDSGARHLEIEYSQLGLRDAISNVWMVSDSAGPMLLLANKFDEYGRVTNSVDRNGVTVSNKFDLLGRVLERRTVGPSGTPAAGLESFGYDLRGLAFYTNALGKRDIFVRDVSGRLVYQTNANNEVLQFTYDSADDLLTLTDGKLQTTTWHYDAYGRPTNKLDQAGVEILRYIYDPEDRLTNRWSKAMGNTTYSQDNVGNLLTIGYPHSGTITYAYDGLNRLTNMVDSVGTTKFTWTAGDQLASEDGPWASDTVTNTYNNRFRSALSLQQPAGTWTNGFGFDEFARLTNVISPAGSSAYQYRDITLPSGDHAASELVARLNLPNTAYITNNQDGLGRLLSTFLKTSGDVTLNSHEYSYNNGSQRTHQTFSGGNYVNYYYDNISQLTNADSSVNTEDRGYAYDAAWNLSWRTNNGAVSQFTVDSKNQYIRAPYPLVTHYDTNGNLIDSQSFKRTYAYDDENRLTEWAAYAVSSSSPSVGDPLTDFIYDGLGRLRKRLEYHYVGQPSSPVQTPSSDWQFDSETDYIYDGNRVIQERDGNNTPTVSYTRGNDLSGGLEGAGGIGGLLARSSGYSSGNWTTHNFYHADGNGNVTYMVNSSQSSVAAYKYDPFGNLISSSGTLAGANVYRFSSKEQHANSGMYYYGFRFYDPSLQRWINRDPLGDVGSFVFQTPAIASMNEFDAGGEGDYAEIQDASIRANLNLYGAIGNNPLSYIDPLGLAECDAGLGPGSLNPENLTALDMRTAAEIAEQKLKDATLKKLSQSRIFGNGPAGSRNIDVNKLRQLLNRQELQKAKDIAQNAVRAAKERLKNAATDKQRKAALNAIETQLNRARACKQALAP